jgi:hypothetical protein
MTRVPERAAPIVNPRTAMLFLHQPVTRLP